MSILCEGEIERKRTMKTGVSGPSCWAAFFPCGATAKKQGSIFDGECGGKPLARFNRAQKTFFRCAHGGYSSIPNFLRRHWLNKILNHEQQHLLAPQAPRSLSHLQEENRRRRGSEGGGEVKHSKKK
jgi:hypothetical protein